jgi:LysM repeat protein
MWLWVVIIGGVIVAWSLYKSRTSSGSSGSSQDTGTPAADVPQFVNQTYTTVQAPNVQEGQEPPEPPEPAVPPAHPPVWRPPAPAQQPPRPGSPRPAQPPIFNATYVVRKGDTLNSVAAKFRITRVELAHANGLGTGAGLRTGQRIKVPQPAPKGTPNKAA